jgi:hypothetical protein
MKKKLRLQIDELRVEQFNTHPDSPVSRGTVHGFETDGIGLSEPCRYCLPPPYETWSCDWSGCC